MKQQHLMINGPAGPIEAILTEPETIAHNIIAIICPPHPLHRGTMHNKIVTTLCRSYRECGIPCLRFNFRGVGKSEGRFDHAVGEKADLLTVIDWATECYPQYKIHLVGFSFGAFIAYSVASKSSEQIDYLITIAPAIHHYSFSELDIPRCNWLLIQGDKDEIVSAVQIYQWIASLDRKPQLLRFIDAGHFFHGKLVELRKRFKAVLGEKLQ